MANFMYARDNNFDVIRLLLACLVMVAHGNGLLALGWNQLLLQQAGLAVHGFFIVSGFLISWSIERKFEIRRYVIKRFSRIYPLYFVIVMIQALLLWWLASAPEFGEALRYVGWNLLFLNFMQPEFGNVIAEPLNGSLWTLKIEVMFYVSLPILVFLTRRFGAWFLLLAFVMAFAWRYGLLEMGYPRLSKQLPGAMTLFITGVAMYRYGNEIYSWLMCRCCWGTKMAMILVAIYLYQLHPAAAMLVYHAALGLGIFVVAFKLPYLRVSRDISYGIYLWHAPIFVLLGLTDVPVMTLYFFGIGLTVILAYMSSHLVEQPMILWGNRKAKQCDNNGVGDEAN